MKGESGLAFSVGVYDTLKFVHVLAAIAWVGSGIYAQVLATRTLRGGDSGHLAVVARDIGEMGLRLITPASLTVLVFGIALVAYAPGWNFTDTRVVAVSRVDLVVLVLVVADMVFKPGT